MLKEQSYITKLLHFPLLPAETIHPITKAYFKNSIVRFNIPQYRTLKSCKLSYNSCFPNVIRDIKIYCGGESCSLLTHFDKNDFLMPVKGTSVERTWYEFLTLKKRYNYTIDFSEYTIFSNPLPLYLMPQIILDFKTDYPEDIKDYVLTMEYQDNYDAGLAGHLKNGVKRTFPYTNIRTKSYAGIDKQKALDSCDQPEFLLHPKWENGIWYISYPHSSHITLDGLFSSKVTYN